MADRDCENCKHYKISDSRSNWNGAEPTYIYSCCKWNCEFEPKDNKDTKKDGGQNE